MNADESVIVVCPKCSAEQEDFDGFGVMYCENCRYCKHPSRDGDGKGGWVCGICGDVKADTP